MASPDEDPQPIKLKRAIPCVFKELRNYEAEIDEKDTKLIKNVCRTLDSLQTNLSIHAQNVVRWLYIAYELATKELNRYGGFCTAFEDAFSAWMRGMNLSPEAFITAWTDGLKKLIVQQSKFSTVGWITYTVPPRPRLLIIIALLFACLEYHWIVLLDIKEETSLSLLFDSTNGIFESILKLIADTFWHPALPNPNWAIVNMLLAHPFLQRTWNSPASIKLAQEMDMPIGGGSRSTRNSESPRRRSPRSKSKSKAQAKAKAKASPKRRSPSPKRAKTSPQRRSPRRS